MESNSAYPRNRLWGAICQNIQLRYKAPGIWVSQCNGRVMVRVGQMNRVSSAVSGAVYSN